jgi:hypothetical protein
LWRRVATALSDDHVNELLDGEIASRVCVAVETWTRCRGAARANSHTYNDGDAYERPHHVGGL